MSLSFWLVFVIVDLDVRPRSIGTRSPGQSNQALSVSVSERDQVRLVAGIERVYHALQPRRPADQVLPGSVAVAAERLSNRPQELQSVPPCSPAPTLGQKLSTSDTMA
jgi:hypothetical protein